MRNIKLTITYEGTNYCGWQVQNSRGKRQGARGKKESIQGVIEKILEKILQEKVRLIGSGRTDAGVHALGQVANFKTNSKLQPGQILRALNSSLSQDIRIAGATEADLNFHSQFRAKTKTYCYLIHNSQTIDPFLFRYCFHTSFPLDISLMRQEAICLKGKHDFKSFCASGSKRKSTVRTIKRISVAADTKSPFWLLPIKANLIIISIEADGFLYNMVRNIVGSLFDIGRGYLKRGDMRRILKGRNRRLAGTTAPAKGLYLCEVKYKKG